MPHSQTSIISLIIFSLSNFCNSSLSAQNYCDSSLIKLSYGPSGYQNRGDRCEGIYIKEVSSSTLMIASFTESFEQFNLTSDKPLLIEWSKSPANSTIHLRAEGIKRKLYYRMDTYSAPGSTSYSWPTSFIASQNITKNDVGIVGTFQHKINQQQRDIYIPLRISQNTRPAKTGNYEIILFPGTELKDVYISLATVDANGQTGTFIKNGEKLGSSYYPAERGIEIPVSVSNTGIYYMEIAAVLRNGGSDELKLWFYHSTN